MSLTPDPDGLKAAQYRKLLRPAFSLSRLPTSTFDVQGCLTRHRLEVFASALGIEEEAECLEGLRSLPLPDARAVVRREFVHLRHRAVSFMLSNNGDLPVISTLLAWGRGSAPLNTSADGSSNVPADDSQDTRGSSSASGSLDSAAALELADLRQKVNALLEEREIPLDGDDDRSAGGRRLVLTDRTLALLPDDIFRRELQKGELSKILRSYPLPQDLRLRSGVLTMIERAKLSASQRVEHDALGSTISDYSSILRPLLALLEFTDHHESAVAHAFFEEIRPFVLAAFSLLFHQNSIRERKRRELMFADQPALQQVFAIKPTSRPMLSSPEQRRIDAIYETEKHSQKLQQFLKPKTSIGQINKNSKKSRGFRTSYGTRTQQFATPAKPAAAASLTQSPFRHSGKGGKGNGKGGRGRAQSRNGEASGPREASAQQE
jgi:hypothetical protein